MNSKTIVVNVTALEALELALQLFQVPLLATLQQNKAFIKILLEYTNYADIFSSDLVIKLPENTSINKHAIKLIESKQLSYDAIYSLSLVKLKTLKA